MTELNYLNLKRLKELLEDAKENHSRFSGGWRENSLAHRGLPKDGQSDRDYDGYPAIRIKYAYQTLEVIRVNVVEPNPTFDFIPLTQSKIETADALDQLIPYQLKRDRFAHKQNIWIEDDFICGLMVAKLAWKHVEARRGGDVIDVMNQPTSIPVDPRKFFPDPSAPYQEEWAYVYHEAELTGTSLQYMADKGYYDASVVAELTRRNNNGRIKTFKVVEYWTAETCQTFCDTGILSNRPNQLLSGKIPFVCASTIPRSRSVFGIPEIELVKGPQELLWVLDNMGIEALKYASRPVVAHRRDRVGGAEVRANMRPGGAVPVGSSDDLQIFFQGGNPELIFKRKTEALADIQNVTGATAYLAGGDSQQYGVNQGTATGISILEAGASKRMKHRMMNLEEFYSAIARGFIELNAQYLPLPQEIKIRSAEGTVPISIDREDISGDYEVYPRWLSEGTNEEAYVQSLQSTFNTLAPLALQGYTFPDGSRLNLQPLIEKMVSARRWNTKGFFTKDSSPLPDFPPSHMLNANGLGPTQ